MNQGIDVSGIVGLINQISTALMVVGLALLIPVAIWSIIAGFLPFQLPRVPIIGVVGFAILFVVIPGIIFAITSVAQSVVIEAAVRTLVL